MHIKLPVRLRVYVYGCTEAAVCTPHKLIHHNEMFTLTVNDFPLDVFRPERSRRDVLFFGQNIREMCPVCTGVDRRSPFNLPFSQVASYCKTRLDVGLIFHFQITPTIEYLDDEALEPNFLCTCTWA